MNALSSPTKKWITNAIWKALKPQPNLHRTYHIFFVHISFLELFHFALTHIFSRMFPLLPFSSLQLFGCIHFPGNRNIFRFMNNFDSDLNYRNSFGFSCYMKRISFRFFFRNISRNLFQSQVSIFFLRAIFLRHSLHLLFSFACSHICSVELRWEGFYMWCTFYTFTLHHNAL